MAVRWKKIFFAPLHSQDGPTVKFIRERLNKQRPARGDDGGVDVQQQYWNGDADDEEALDLPKRNSRR